MIQDDNLELAGTIGMHVIDLSTSIRSTGGLLNEASPVAGPLPAVGVSLDYHFTPDVHGSLQGQWFSLQANGFDGMLQDYRVTLEYMIRDHLGLGVGYNYFDTSKPYQE
ncbi:MAG: hypothetical protein Q9M29_06755 [Mariprofundaceae bacterium]|nr:hypothetical protein [Mariprofundaceae bacterium]